MEHLEEQINLTGRTLGDLNEQSSESCHSDFDVYWNKFRIRDHTNEKVGENLLKCVNDYNGNHL